MSTNSCIARPDTRGGQPYDTAAPRFRGRYVHWDGYPSGVGRDILDLYQRPVERGGFGRDFARLTRSLLDEHPAGFSYIQGDWTKTVGFRAPGDVSEGPECYCHGDRGEEPYDVTHKNAQWSGCEYAYVLHRAPLLPGGEVVPVVDVLTSVTAEYGKMIGRFGMGDTGARWAFVRRLPLDADMTKEEWASLDEAAKNPAASPAEEAPCPA